MHRLLFFPSLLLFSFCKAQKLTRDELKLGTPNITNCTPVKDQFMSSTCWSFSSNSFLESELLRNRKGEYDLSEMFVARYSMIRKIKRHLQLKGGNFFTPGGQFHDVVWVLKNYGIVPEAAYPGRNRGEKYHDHAEMDTLLSEFVKACVKNKITILTPPLTFFVDSVLDQYLGPVPASFIYEGKKYTSLSFLKNELQLNPDDFIEITSYTHHPYYTQFILEDKYNWTADAYWNVPLTDFSLITNTAVDNGYTIGWDGDATDDYFDFAEGLAYLPEDMKDYSSLRQVAFENKSTELDHMMHIVGRSAINGSMWYCIKNSWGNTTNPLGGFMWMREDYFKMRTVAIIVNKKALPDIIRKKLGL